MARTPRNLEASTWHHVMNRGADRQDIYSGDGDCRAFLVRMVECCENEAVEIHAFALMGNHFHFVLRDPERALSQVMRRACSAFASSYNRTAGRTGPLLEGRFVSIPIADPTQLMVAGRYVHRNPIAFCPVDAIGNYAWSSLGAYAGLATPPSWLEMETLMEPFAGDRQRYLRFVQRAHPSDVVPFGPRRALHPVDVDQVIAAVRDVGGASIDAIRTPGSCSTLDSRLAAITLSVKLRSASSAELAVVFGMADPSSLRRAARRGRVKAEREPLFRAFLERIHTRVSSMPDRQHRPAA